jgi:hypothetical protein
MGVLIILTAFLLIPNTLFSYQEVKQEAQLDEKPVIHPGPQNIVEKIGIYVFLAWIWISIVVLTYFLRLKVKEADRLYELRFYDAHKKELSH